MIDLIDLTEIPAMIESETGLALGFTTKKILYLAQNNQFPKPRVHLHRKLIRFDRREVTDWIAKRFPSDNKKHAKRDPAARDVKVARNARRA